MKSLQLIKSEPFFGVQCDFYQDGRQDIVVTREQIGQALGYENPMIAIAKIHDRHKDRLDKFSVLTKLGNAHDGKTYKTYVYSALGVYEICRWSRQARADDFMDWVWSVIEKLRTGQAQLMASDSSLVIQALEQRIAVLEQQLGTSNAYRLDYIISLLEGRQKPLQAIAGQTQEPQSGKQLQERQTPQGIPTQTSIKSPVQETVKQPDTDSLPKPEKRLLNIDEFMEYTGLGRIKATQLAKESDAVMKIGSRFLVDKRKFNRWCDTNNSIK